MRLGTWRAEDGLRVVAQVGDGWLDVFSQISFDPRGRDLAALIRDWDELGPGLQEAAARAASGGIALTAANEAALAAPVPSPRRVLCIGHNYRAHVAEQNAEMPKAPEVFIRLASTLRGPRDAILLPRETPEVDYEAELCVVIGKGGRRIAKEDALSAVFGWTVLNDVSVRSYQYRGQQWTPGKNFEGTAPCGPYVVTRDEVPDPQALEVSCVVSGEELQRGRTADMIFDVASIVADLSVFTALQPGDLICTGTPPGVGMARRPQRWLRPGDTVVSAVSGVGEIENVCVVD
ncbi:MAG: fumarylacetoacetate hydrolase family protein [Thermaerobacter sp.]|nr:fumarylacetoacetate hydrolase family protein [Thermaerobacter sp.]